MVNAMTKSWQWFDWATERGSDPRPPTEAGYGDGYGGYGDGYGYGYGDGDGAGYGAGYGYGDGDGDGYGDGYGAGYGYGDGDPRKGLEAMPEVGKRMLIVCGYGWVVCGDVVEQTGPFTFRVENCSVIVRTGGVPWDELADGNDLRKATYRHWGTVNVGPTFGPCREWLGELPCLMDTTS